MGGNRGLAAAVCVAAGMGYLAAGAVPNVGPIGVVLVVAGGVLTALGVVRCGGAREREAPATDAGEPLDPGTVLWRVRASVRDTPGRLAGVAGGLAELGGNIRMVHVHPTQHGAVDEILVHAPVEVTAATLCQAVHAAGAGDVTAVQADVRELDDVPTRAFTLATRLVDGSAVLTQSLRQVLGDIAVQYCEHSHDEDLTTDGMLLRAPGGGMLRLRRSRPAFTPAEFARARAMTELAGACHARVHEAGERVVLGGCELLVRRADRADLDAVMRFHENCSPAARVERYFMAVAAGRQQRQVLQRLLTPTLGRTLLVLREHGQTPAGEGAGDDVIAMGNLMYDGAQAEIGLLVRDDWQCHGLGTLLAQRLITAAGQSGVSEVRARTRVHNTAIARTLRSAGLTLSGVADPGEWSWSRTIHSAGQHGLHRLSEYETGR